MNLRTNPSAPLRVTIRVALIVLLQIIFGGVSAIGASKDSASIPNDSSSIELRQPDASAQDEIYNDEDFKYVTEENKSSSEQSFFDRLLEDLMRSLFDDMSDSDSGSSRSGGVNWWSWFFIIAGVGLLVFFIIKATGAGGGTLFKGKSKRKEKIDATLEDVDIHAIDYDREIAGARARSDFRFAVRLWFLRSLKEMADRKFIEWKIDKTNTDYYYELSGSKLQHEFGKISLLYDYVWYGEFKIDELRYHDAEKDLQQFHRNITKTEGAK